MRFASAVLLVVAGLLGSTAVAQGSRISGDEYEDAGLSTNKRRLVMADFARCVVARRPALASEAILLNVDNSTFMRRYGKLADGDCLLKAYQTFGGVQMALPGDLMRYALADALVAAELSGAVPTDFSVAAPLEHRQVDDAPLDAKLKGRKLAEAEQASAKAQAWTIFSRFGECVVRTQQAKARALLTAKPASPEEGQAFAAITPDLGYCLAQGSQFAINRTNLRGTLALNYFRLAMAPRTQAPAAGVTQ